MSNSSYALINDSNDKSSIDTSIQKVVSPRAMDNADRAIRKRFIQITIAVALYWYETISHHCFAKLGFTDVI